MIPQIVPRPLIADTPAAEAVTTPSERKLDERLFIACGLSWVTALIHAQAAIQHVAEYLLYAVFFVLLATAQVLWGIAVYRSPSRRLLIAGAAMSLAVVALWIASRTIGLPIGPDPGSPEPVGAIDVVATTNEVLLAVLVVLQLRHRNSGAMARIRGRVVIAVAMGLILLSSLALIPGHTHPS
jgi:hypothetical protein